jgi:two-component system, cell cycle sensor histidine kinase and response regulator CckA
MINPVTRYREFVDGDLLAVYDSTVDGRLVSCNLAFARLIGFDSVEEAIGCDLHSLYMKSDNRAAFMDRIRREKRVQGVRGRMQNRRGEIVHVLLTGIGDFNHDDKLVGLHGYMIDVSASIEAQRALRERERELEERLKQAEKLETVGRLAGGIAHDFNNLLTAILGYSELLLGSQGLSETEQHDLVEIQKAGQRAAALTQQLLAFSRKQVLNPREVDLNGAVANLQTMLRRLIREDIALTCDLASAPVVVRVDPVQIEQVVLNLVLNARDALPTGGHIRLEVSRVGQSQVNVPPEVGPVAVTDYVRLRVSDDGVGIAPEAQAHLFEPFYTTKEVGKGTGLGLASAYGIVRQSNGFITVDSEPGHGTTFTMYFPAASEAHAESAAVPITRAAPGQETILLVEDEDAVRTIISEVLRRQGYRVLEAATPTAAQDLFERHSAEIDLLLSDVVMPGMNGPALAQRLVAQRPDLRVLFISGYADASRPFHLSNVHVDFLGKPFQPSVLAGRVREMLTRGSEPHTRTVRTGS